MHQLREQEPFTGVLITHDLREAIFLADEVVVLSGRPATMQFKQTMMEKGPRSIEQLYTPRAMETLNILRNKLKLPVKMRGLSLRQVMVPVFAIVLFLAFWELTVWLNDWPNYKMASPVIYGHFWRFKWLFMTYGWETLWRTVIGLIIAVLVGLAFGIPWASLECCGRVYTRYLSDLTRSLKRLWCQLLL